MANTKLSLKLLIDTNRNKVLFAEAGKDFVDFLFNLLALPIGTIISLLQNNMVGSLANLYQSVESLDETYMQSGQCKESLLKPKYSSSAAQVPLLLANEPPPVETVREFYRCSNYNCYDDVSDNPKAKCSRCRCEMSTKVSFVVPEIGQQAATFDREGYVKGVVTYMVMDDLAVTPMSTISSITLLNKFNVKEIGALEEKVVHFGMDEGLKLLTVSMQSKSVLTGVFLDKK